MKSIHEQMESYASYHRDARNKATHFVGVPLITFSIFLALSWFRFVDPAVPLTAATLFYLGVGIYYLRLDFTLALLQAPITLLLLWAADRVALWPLWQSLAVFLVAFVGGWIIQLVGHVFEGRKPALVDNILQVFNAPLFLTVEVLHGIGVRTDLKTAVMDTRPSQQTAAAKGGSCCPH